MKEALRQKKWHIGCASEENKPRYRNVENLTKKAVANSIRKKAEKN